MPSDEATVKPIYWIGRSLRDLREFPKQVRITFGQALFDAQRGGKHPDAKPLKGYGGAGVMEVIEDERGSTFRAMYTVEFAGIVYVLHAFQKKSKSGIKTPKVELDTVRSRLKDAEEHYAEWKKRQEQEAEDSE